MRNYTPEHDAEPLTQQHVLLFRHMSLVSAYVPDACYFWTGRICGLGQYECDIKSHWVGPPIDTILPLPSLRQHFYCTSCIPDVREDVMRYAPHLSGWQPKEGSEEGCFLAIAFDSVLLQPNRAHHHLLHKRHQIRHQCIFLLYSHQPRSHRHHWRQHGTCFLPDSGMRQLYLEAVSTSRWYPFFDPVSDGTQYSSPVPEVITCVFFCVKIRCLTEETAEAILNLLDFQSTGKPCSMSLVSRCTYLLFCQFKKYFCPRRD